ncbi:hypothetical protein TWF694_002511 [Orbilia ellipsospora]|uniref:Uncharacterized protein n=1 Tax=Orbilia ellipsospora TaxID=2528407 RepID=A0AAV9X268_9PEZI
MKAKATMPLALLSPEAVALGRFVTNTKCPAEEFHDSELILTKITSKNVHVTARNNFREVLRYTSGTSLHSTLTTIISSHSSFKALDHIQMEGLVNKTYQLENSTAIFEDLCEDPKVRKWLLKMIARGRSINMVVGYETIVDASISFNNHRTKKRGGEITAPISCALAASLAVPLLLGDTLDVGVGASKTKGCGIETSFFAPGEMIFAVQYRKLQFSWFSSRDVDRATLQKSRWKINIGIRSLNSFQEDDVIDARLESEPLDARSNEGKSQSPAQDSNAENLETQLPDLSSLIENISYSSKLEPQSVASKRAWLNPSSFLIFTVTMVLGSIVPAAPVSTM